MKKGLLILAIAFVGLLTACGTGSTGSSEAGKDSVNIGYFPNLDHAAGIVGKEKGFFDDELGEVEATYIDFPNGNDFIEALDAGTLDIGYVGPGPAINYYLRGGDVVILSAAANGATLIVARDGSGIEELADFDGKSFCTPGNGCTHNVQLEAMLKELGLESNRVGGTVEHQPRVAPANMVVMFEQGQIDATAAPEPWGTYLVEELGAKVVTEWNDVFLGERLASVVLVSTKEFVENNPDIVDAVLKGHIQSVEYAQNNEEDTLQTINDALYNLTQQRLPDSVLTNAWQRMAVTTETHADALQAWADASYDLQFIKDDPNLDGFVDTSRLDALLNK
ncbi:aliphatic sulfonate ABC transporter substrate-binding protein [Alkalihalobacillus sp. LMS39]|uniref:aliphatic sulfonate ABC transporter substrate-binding protein n=1 Tax=Alkalihalobacillus sp. LMS39 TaxID=2924032 RepID=UPI001FB2A979|nr:aliphatic sulfonate ABC transporter substrate-binding protein [Alkalihalobacillus sp. LMS39]UOE95516.1 aliphatic sulfonate ABC transporter substrate-binding protein [Alkalihalobacillus sp. LMS39]